MDEHSPVDWFTPAVYPSCTCGFAPADNRVLIAHWAEYGVEWVDDHGTLIARSIEPTPLDVWLRFADDDPDHEQSELEANTWRNGDGYRVKWYHVDVGIVTRVDFDTLDEAHAWYEREGFEDYSS